MNDANIIAIIALVLSFTALCVSVILTCISIKTHRRFNPIYLDFLNLRHEIHGEFISLVSLFSSPQGDFGRDYNNQFFLSSIAGDIQEQLSDIKAKLEKLYNYPYINRKKN